MKPTPISVHWVWDNHQLTEKTPKPNQEKKTNLSLEHEISLHTKRELGRNQICLIPSTRNRNLHQNWITNIKSKHTPNQNPQKTL